MKSRRNFVVAILLVAIMCIGVGFAAMTSVINGTGTITYNPTFNIEWTENVTGASDVVVSKDAHENDTLAFTVDTSEMAKNATTTVTATVKNNSKYDAKNIMVSSVTYGDNNSYYEVDVADVADIAAGATGTVTITIKLTEYPQVDDDYEVTFTFSVTAKQDV